MMFSQSNNNDEYYFKLGSIGFGFEPMLISFVDCNCNLIMLIMMTCKRKTGSIERSIIQNFVHFSRESVTQNKQF